MPLITKKYDYVELKRVDGGSGRKYVCPDGNAVPSVTRVLSSTKPEADKKSLDRWIKSVGEVRAESIRNEAATVGTYMHKCLECNILDEEYVKFDPLFSQARGMADRIIDECFDDIQEIWGTEVKLYYPGKYAGTTDVVGVYKENEWK